MNGPDPSGLIHVKESAIRAGPIKVDQSNQSKTAETGNGLAFCQDHGKKGSALSLPSTSTYPVSLGSFLAFHQPFRRASLAQGPEPVEGHLSRLARRSEVGSRRGARLIPFPKLFIIGAGRPLESLPRRLRRL